MPPGTCENEMSFLVSVMGSASAYPESIQYVKVLASGYGVFRISSCISPVSSDSDSLRKRRFGKFGKPSLPRRLLRLGWHFSHVQMSVGILWLPLADVLRFGVLTIFK